MTILNSLPLTKLKIWLAKRLYWLTRLFVKGDRHIIQRQGISYEVDLTEGLDLSLFLFGNFQSHVSKNKYVKLPADAVIFDVGANVGVMTLQFAQVARQGRVYAFEPTHYALQKLTKNLELNPELGTRVQTIQTFVTSEDKIDKEITAYSSWKVGGKKEGDEHPVHQGTAMSAEGVGSITLDDFCERENIDRLDFVKIDTDGHEPDVLNGFKRSLNKFRPVLIFEIGLYVMEEKGIDFGFYASLFDNLNYKLYNSANLKKITLSNYKNLIPKKGTIDILAIPT